MVGGQAIDLQAGGQAPHHPVTLDADGLRAMHARKTGALIRASAACGALMAGASERLLDQAIHSRDVYGSQLLDLTVWNRSGVLVYSPTHDQAPAQDYGFSTATGVDGPDSVARRRGLAGHTVVEVGTVADASGSLPVRVLETYVPLQYEGDLIPSGVVRIGLPYAPVANAISERGLPGDVYRAATVRTGKPVR